MKDSYEEYFALIRDRYSVRKFSEKRIEQEKIDKILEAGRVAPTACNRQPQRILVISGDEALGLLRKCTMSHFNCTLAMLVCYDKDECWKREYDGKSSGDVDASIVATQLMLAASALGIGSTFVMHFIPEAVKTEFNIPDRLEPSSLLVMGYPAADAKPSSSHTAKKELKETVFYNTFD